MKWSIYIVPLSSAVRTYFDVMINNFLSGCFKHFSSFEFLKLWNELNTLICGTLVQQISYLSQSRQARVIRLHRIIHRFDHNLKLKLDNFLPSVVSVSHNEKNLYSYKFLAYYNLPKNKLMNIGTIQTIDWSNSTISVVVQYLSLNNSGSFQLSKPLKSPIILPCLMFINRVNLDEKWKKQKV